MRPGLIMGCMSSFDPGEDPPHRRPARPPADREPSGRARFLQRSGRGAGGDRLLARLLTIGGAAGIVAAGFVISRLLGLVRSVVIADAFGTDPELSAYWVAFRLPDLVFQLLAGATLSAAFIPTFSRVLLRGGEEAAWRLASTVLNLIAIATFVAAGLAWLLAPMIVPWLAPGLGEATGRQEELRALAVSLTRIMLISPLFFGVSGMLTGILNARQHFAAPALAPVIYNLGIIFGAVVLARPLGVDGLAWGVVLGALGHLAVQVPALRVAGMRWSPSFDVMSEAVLDVLRLMGPRVIGLAATQVNFLVIVFFASFVSDQAISAMNYAFLMMMLPVGVIGMAISTAAFPTMAQQAAASDLAQLRASVSRALRVILFLSIPASAGLIVLAVPLIRLLLERGAFDATSTELVAGALVVYGLGIFAHSGVEILSRGFYALSDTRTPVAVAVAAMAMNVAFAALLLTPFGVRGLAGAASLAATLEFALLLRLLDVRLGGLERRELRRTVGGAVLASVVMAEVVVVALILLNAAGMDDGGWWRTSVQVVVGGGLGALVFLAVAYRLNRDDVELITRRLRST